MILRKTLTSSKLKTLVSLSCLSPTHVLSPHQNPIFPLIKPFPAIFEAFSSQSNVNRDGNYYESTSQSNPICPGCGIHIQGSDPNSPGFFIKPSSKSPNYGSRIDKLPLCDEPSIPFHLKMGFLREFEQPNSPNPSPHLIEELDYKSRVDNRPCCDEMGISGTSELGSLQEFENSQNPNDSPNLIEKPLVCARCHSLRHYGKVKDRGIENLLPDFDFDHTIGRKLALTTRTRSVVMMVVDAADFDGSFPRKVARLVSETIDENSTAWKEGKSGNVPRVVLVVTKIDLLPSSISPTRLEHWVRQRAREGGANKITSVHLVSSIRDWGLKNLVDDVVALAGARGNVWAIGAQNVGKSTLINSIGKHVGGKVTHLTEAPVPGTTLGIVRVEGVLPGQAKLFDTPGLLHPHQITTRLTREEQKLVQVSKELKPRTYRIKAGQSVHIAGLMRLDVEESSVDSIYVTVWASPYLPLHMGKIENVSTMFEEHFGRQLQPPIGEKRVAELGKWVRTEFQITGNCWDSSSIDIAAAGLGWFAIGLKGEVSVGVWTYEGIDITLRNSLIPYRSQVFEVAGFTVSKIVSKADQASNKSLRQSEKRRKMENPEAKKSTLVDSC